MLKNHCFTTVKRSFLLITLIFLDVPSGNPRPLAYIYKYVYGLELGFMEVKNDIRAISLLEN